MIRADTVPSTERARAPTRDQSSEPAHPDYDFTPPAPPPPPRSCPAPPRPRAPARGRAPPPPPPPPPRPPPPRRAFVGVSAAARPLVSLYTPGLSPSSRP